MGAQPAIKPTMTTPLRTERMTVTRLLPLLVILAALCGCPESPPELFGPHLEACDSQVLEEQGARIIAAIDAWREAHGQWPASLAEAGVQPADIETKFGPWRYLPSSEDPSRFHLAVGDYARNHFALWWNWTLEDWYWDT